MLTQQEFKQWCQQLGLEKTTARAIADIRSLPPTRRVTSRAGNVSGRYPSRKMGVTIQFESHTVTARQGKSEVTSDLRALNWREFTKWSMTPM